jgi:DegV family protein with EDD domain
MAIKVVTDSGADIPSELAKKLGITVVPLTVSFGDESYKDGVEISADEFYNRLTQGEIMPTTSQPSVGSFVETYRQLEPASNEILSIHVSSKLSGTMNSATQAAKEENIENGIEFVDSWQASMGLGFSVIAAAEAVKAGASLSEAASAARSVLERTNVFILFETLKYLEKGGRIGRAQALVGSVLQLKPILTLDQGEIATKVKVRTFAKGIRSLEELSEGCGKLERAAVLYTTDKDKANTLGERIQNFADPSTEPLVVRLSPAIGTHGGPGVLGIICVTSMG